MRFFWWNYCLFLISLGKDCGCLLPPSNHNIKDKHKRWKTNKNNQKVVQSRRGGKWSQRLLLHPLDFKLAETWCWKVVVWLKPERPRGGISQRSTIPLNTLIGSAVPNTIAKREEGGRRASITVEGVRLWFTSFTVLLTEQPIYSSSMYLHNQNYYAIIFQGKVEVQKNNCTNRSREGGDNDQRKSWTFVLPVSNLPISAPIGYYYEPRIWRGVMRGIY